VHRLQCTPTSLAEPRAALRARRGAQPQPQPRALAARAAALVALAVVLALACAASAGAEATATTTKLSDQRTLSRWAYPQSEAVIRAEPAPRSRGVGRLRFLTGDAQAEVYLALEAVTLPSGARWTRIEVPGRPNGRSGWVPSAALGTLHAVRGYLLIDRRRLRATLFRDGRPVFSAPVGVGKPATPTPAGEFYVMEKLVTVASPAYGPYAVGTSAYAPTLSEWPGGGVVGIHGTNEPQLVPGRPSHGCVRMHNADISRLWHMIAVGTPIEIA
jgi:L,D-transpeptidase catalytic domain